MVYEGKMSLPVIIDGKNLQINEVIRVARENEKVRLSREARANVKKSRHILEKWVSESRMVYGLTTGLGALCDKFIPVDKAEMLQTNLIRSHASGVGNAFPTEVVRAMMLARANLLSRGFSGVRLSTLISLVDMINKQIHPVVPKYGSLGASGDLIPLAHIALGLVGEGLVEYRGKLIRGHEALRQAKIQPVQLSYKEGLALINGTSAMTAIGALVVDDALNLIKSADIASSVTFEALRGNRECLDKRIQILRGHPGQLVSAHNVRKMIEGSELVFSTYEAIDRSAGADKGSNIVEPSSSIQDAYSLRCIPQVHGAVRDCVNYVRAIIQRELNAVTDNPLVDPESEKPLHGGNFHGQPVAFAMDFLSIAIAELAVISERRLNRLMNPRLNKGLPAFLAKDGTGLENGMIATQYVAASLSSECISLASPASLCSVTTDADNEDIVSMGVTAANRAVDITRKVEYVIASELLSATEALNQRFPLRPGSGTRVVYDLLRRQVSPLTKDRPLSDDLESVVHLVRSKKIVRAVENTLGWSLR